ncbi:MAG: RNA polymerase sigma-70 factor [Saprospirales bacterium]|nr:RNA polymerase sigma-70 factor [Saprospirales bacterium]MBK8491061.1 RNA polymerase sigma-70 factor [Saprospirales bacterium]
MSTPLAHTTLDKPLFEQLFKAHFVALCNFGYQLVQDMDSAKDIAQKVFINLWENREGIDPKRSVQSYLYTSVRNRCLNHIRDQKKYRSQVLDLEIMDIEISIESDDSGLEELQDKITEALSTLPEKCRLVFEMSRFQDKKYKDIAAELNISEKTVEAHMSRALKTLREELKEYFPLFLLLGLL